MISNDTGTNDTRIPLYPADSITWGAKLAVELPGARWEMILWWWRCQTIINPTLHRYLACYHWLKWDIVHWSVELYLVLGILVTLVTGHNHVVTVTWQTVLITGNIMVICSFPLLMRHSKQFLMGWRVKTFRMGWFIFIKLIMLALAPATSVPDINLSFYWELLLDSL